MSADAPRDPPRGPRRDSKPARSAVPSSVAALLRRHPVSSSMGLTMLVTGAFAMPARAGAPPPVFGTPGWFAQKMAQPPSSHPSSSPGAASSLPGGVSTATQAAAQTQRSVQDLDNAAAAIRTILASQQQAASKAAASAASTVPNGLTPGGQGGLEIAPPATADGSPNQSGISSVSQSTKGSKTTVTVTQNASDALVTWTTFNVGKNTTLDFDQSAGTQTNGNNNWVVLNRVLGNSDKSPSKILGSIEAQGSVYIIDQNGILFGAGSQVNTHSLLASSLSYSQAFPGSGLVFLTGQAQTVLSGSAASGPIVVEQGATIKGGDQGFVILAAPSLTNSGVISAQNGQTILAAGEDLRLSPAPVNGDGQMAADIQTGSSADKLWNTGQGFIQSVEGSITLLSPNVEQDGVVEATTGVTHRGSITIVGGLTTTGGDQVPGFLGSAGSIVLGSGSVTAILPQEDGVTTTSSQAATNAFNTPPGGTGTVGAAPLLNFTAGSVTLLGQDPSGRGALIEAPGATLTVLAVDISSAAPGQGRIFTGTGATIDVAGLANVQLPVSDSLLTIGPLTQNDLADSPLLKDGFLFTSTVTIDTTVSGVSPDGQSWVGSPLINASAYVQNIPRTIDQLLTNGGTVNFTADQVITAKGSSINIAGGYVSYQGGLAPSPTRLLGADGLSYAIGSADPTINYVGFAGQTTVDSTRWNLTATYTNPLLAGTLERYTPGFVQGGTGGVLNVSAGSAIILDGSISAGVVAGRNQVASNAQPAGSQLNINNIPGTAVYGIALGPSTPLSIDLTSQPLDLQQLAQSAGDSSFTASTPLVFSSNDPADRSNLQYWMPLDASALSAAGFSSITLGGDVTHSPLQIFEEPGAALSVTPAGLFTPKSGTAFYDQISLTAGFGGMTLNGALNAPAGVITAASASNITVGTAATLNASGEWVNDTGRSPNQISGNTFINGGSISLSVSPEFVQVQVFPPIFADASGSIILAPGSTLNVASGGYVSPLGKLQMSGNLPAGAGGSINLVTYAGGVDKFDVDSSGFAPTATPFPNAGSLEIAGANLIGYGFSKGGTLTLQALWVQVGGTDAGGAPVLAPETEGGTLYLPASFLAGGSFKDPVTGAVTTSGGFGSYALNAEYNATVTAGTTVPVTQQNLIVPSYPALLAMPTGTNLLTSAATQIGTVDAFDRQPTSLTLTGGDYLTWIQKGNSAPSPPDYSASGITGTLLIGQQAALQADPGAQIVLGSPGTVEVLGSVTAHGGSISLDGLNASRIFGDDGMHDSLTTPAQAVLLGPQAQLDVSGTTLINPFATPVPINGQPVIPVTGTVQPGGSISLYGATVASASGSVLDVSGTTAMLEVLQNATSAAGRLIYAPTPEWSDAGQINLGASDSLYLASTLRAQPGSGPDGSGSGATLTLTDEAASGTVELLQSTNGLAAGTPPVLPAGWQPGDPVPSAAGTLYLPTGGLSGAGIWNLVLNSNTQPRLTIGPFDAVTGENLSLGQLTVAFAGDLDLHLRESFVADAVAYTTVAAPGASAGTPATANVFAPYIALEGYYFSSRGGFAPSPQPGSGTLNIGNLDPAKGPVTQQIDLGGELALQNTAAANFASAGGIRFVTSNLFDFDIGITATPRTGELYSAGSLSFTATELYPASGNSFVVLAGGAQDANGQAIPAGITINAASSASPQVPLSAGGSLLFDASTITQNGTIWAPSGTIVLGVSNPQDPATQTQFGASNLVATSQVSLGAGSTTSVSLGGATLPYGTTVDGQEWQYNSDPYLGAADLTAPPPKLIQINAANITLGAATSSRPAAAIDLQGGGSLQAQEWVPGVGGSRDVLSQVNTSFTESVAGSQVPLYPDDRGIYALVPGYEAPVAAYDPVFAQGQAPIGVGEAITISGGNGIPAGTYVLMPAKYATLPGSFRVVQDTSIIDSVPAQNGPLSDGTQVISGYFSNALTGARGSRSVTFDLQSTDQGVWQQYSQYALTSADTFFANLAANNGVPTPQLPRDAGQLVLGASGSLSLGATLKTSPGTGGAAAEIDIASQDIQIIGTFEPALPGYLQLPVASLDNLGAGSLLIGGTRSQTSAGLVIDPLAQSVVVSNDNSSPLTGNQILLVASDTVQVDGGSLIRAPAPAAGSAAPAGTPLIIGQASQPGSGNGALLMVSSAGPAPLSRISATGSGTLSVGQGVIDGGGFLLLDSAGNTVVNGNGTLTGQAITADAGAVTFVAGSTSQSIPGMVIGPATLAQLANATQVSLRSYGAIDFEGSPSIAVGSAAGDSLELSAAAFTAGAFGNKGSLVSITAPTLILTNEASLSAQTSITPAAGGTRLQLMGSEVDFGTASGTNPALFSGFSGVSLTAGAAATRGGSPPSSGVVTRGGSFDFGSVDLSITAPVVFAGSGSTTALTTTGAVTVSASADMPLSSAGQLGGQLSLTGGSLTANGVIEAPAGNLLLTAATGTLLVSKGAQLSVAGAALPFYDITEFAPAGTLSLSAQQGNVQVQAGATLDFSGSAGGGNAGALMVSAPAGTATLQGTLKDGVAQAPLGSAAYTAGSVSIAVGGAEDLSALAQVLQAAGAAQSLAVVSGTGDLVLNSGDSLTAQKVTLVASRGNVIIDGSNGTAAAAKINADGVAGGNITLYGTQGVDVEGTLQARASSSTQLGGSVVLGTSTLTPATGTLNTQYGYESVDPAASGTITLGASALIDVTGGATGGHSGGTVSLRAPLLSSGDVNIQVASTARIAGATAPGSVSVEPYAVWSTSDPVVNAAQHFDGIIDPAGWYDSSGQLVSGTFYNQDGLAVASGSNLSADPNIATYLTQDYFVPTTANASHQSFYGYVNGDSTQGAGTLMGFVENPGFSSSFQSRMATLAAAGGSGSFAVTPGIELDNPVSANVNGGNIELLSNWNLGAGTLAANGAVQGAFRYQGAAPILTLRAGNNLVIGASLSDGFYQYDAGPDLTFVASQYDSDNTTYQQFAQSNQAALTTAGSGSVSVNLGGGAMSVDLSGVPGYVAVAAPLENQSADYYSEYSSYRLSVQSWLGDLGRLATTQLGTGVAYTIAPSTLGTGAPNVSSYPATAAGYGMYVTDYQAWLTSTYTSQATLGTLGTTPPPPQLPLLPTAGASQQPLSSAVGEPGTYQQYLTEWARYATTVNALDGGFTHAGASFAYIFPPLPPLAAQLPVTAGIDAGNLPANTPSPDNVAPLAYAELSGGNSTSYRLVAGADLTSPNPLALQPATVFAAGGVSPLAGGGSVLIAGHTVSLDENGASVFDMPSFQPELVFPTSVRTGNGAISIASANDIELTDSVAPGVIYTAGVPVAGTASGALSVITHMGPNQVFITPPAVNSSGAGNISLLAQNDIQGIEQVLDSTGQITAVAGTDISQSWATWLQANATKSSSFINFSNFDQGVLAAGGNVSVAAGGNIVDLSVSLPSTWSITSDGAGNPLLNVYGGGNLSVSAGNNVVSGSYYVSKGSGELQAGGAIQSGISLPGSDLATLIGLQDAQIQLLARDGIELGGIFDPSYVGNDHLPYSTSSAANILSVSGDVRLQTLSQSLPFLIVSSNSDVLPASLTATALQGGISVENGGLLFPSPQGELSLVASGDINLFNSQQDAENVAALQMLDVDPQDMPSPLNSGVLVRSGPLQHDAAPLHAGDTVPVRIYSLDGSVINERLNASGFYADSLQLVTDKPTLIYAADDILNLNFIGQNLRDSDITRIVAGHDILDTPLSTVGGAGIVSLVLGGPGTFDIEAGRNLGPLTNEEQAVKDFFVFASSTTNPLTGIDAVGNKYNPSLANQSASIDVLFGVGPGINTAGFIAKYIGTPGNAQPGVAAIPGVPDYSGADPSNPVNLVSFMDSYEAGLSYTYSDGLLADHVSNIQLTPAQAWAAYQKLPAYEQQLFVNQVFSNLLFLTGQSYNDPTSAFFHQYARGYGAINTLFPPALGYTANNLTGIGPNGSRSPVTTGNLDLRESTIQTQQGGDINIFGPGGQALLGSASAPPYFVDSGGNTLAGPNSIGILTLEQGNIDIFTDQSILLAQSRVFTEQGGNLLMWSSNGDINAGNGLKSTTFVPPLTYSCDPFDYCVVQPAGEVTGAGIATLQTIPGAPPGDVELVAPVGTVDAGQAGIRVSGNLTIAAAHVANVFNIQVQGKEVGIPNTAVNTAALTAAQNAANGGQNVQNLLPKSLPAELQITVDVLGYGSPDEEQQKKLEDEKNSGKKQ